jgi:hypothetical protein
MATTSENIDTGLPEGDAGRSHTDFLERHRPLLLRQLEGEVPVWGREAEALAYVDAVLAEWHERFDAAALPAAGGAEQTFWFALYQLEELAERPDARNDPYVQYMMETLVEVRELLRRNRPLPDGRYIATRPDGS